MSGATWAIFMMTFDLPTNTNVRQSNEVQLQFYKTSFNKAVSRGD
jgi:hypothetical protein